MSPHGAHDTSISTVDADGVALAAIQALAAENARLREELEAIKKQWVCNVDLRLIYPNLGTWN